MTSFLAEVKPAKKHYNKFLAQTKGTWVFDTKEEICQVSKGTLKEATSKATFKPHYPTELALAYGLKNGLIKTDPMNQQGYIPVRFTEKGLKDVEKLQKTTCAFTGRRVRSGEF